MDYHGEVLEELGNLRIGPDSFQKGEEYSWFLPFYKAYISYLARLPSVSEVLLRAKESNETKLSCETLLEDIYRLINQVKLISDVTNNVFNTVGRYYKEKIKIYKALFDVIWNEMMMIYDYLRRAIHRIFNALE